MKPKRIILFDLDGTLTWGVSTTRFLFRKMGQEPFFKELESDWLREQTDHLTLARKVTARMKDWKTRDIEKALRAIPKMRRIGFTVRTLKKKGYYTALSTLGYEFAAKFFQDWYGFDEVRGTSLGIRGGVITGKGMKIFQEHEKSLFLKGMARKFSIPLSETVALGDSRSDREVFKTAGFRIAVNHDGFLKGKADKELKGRDLGKILKYL